jgi:4-amino-4-deoxy-L-arabinose transferase-like glycosyltransferase
VVVGRFSWPIGSPHQAVILWGGWLITAGIFFSIAGFFHEYYLSTLAPPLAALVGIGISQTWRISRQRLWLGGIIIVVVTALTLVLQYNTAKEFVNNLSWLPMVMGIFSAGAVLILAANIIRHPMEKSIARMGFTCLVAAMLITPGIWSGLTNLHSSDNQSLPAAYDGRSNGPTNSGLIQVDTKLLEFLQANTQGMYYLMAVPSSMQGADYILATGRPVLYMGGFMGQDQVLTADSLASLVNEGKLRFIYWNATNDGRGGGSPISGQSGVTNWVSGHCTVVQGYNTLTHNTGAPDGINGGTGSDGFLGGAQSVVLYDCGQ